MAYNINKTDGTLLVTIPNNRYVPAGTQGGVLDLTLYGQGKLDYGESWNENFVHLLENFANTVEPSFPQDGMLWFDQGATLLKFWNETGSQWESLVTSGAGASTFVNVTGDTMTGDLVFDIPSAGLPADSPGILFTGNTDEASIYVEEQATEQSALVIQITDNYNNDSISIRQKVTGDTFPVEILRLDRRSSGGPGIMAMQADDGTAAPGTTADTIIFNEGAGDINIGPDIRFSGAGAAAGLITANDSLVFVIDDDNNSTTAEFQIAVHGRTFGTFERCANFNETGGLFCALRAPSLTPPTGSGTGFADWFLGTGGNNRNIHMGSTNQDIDKIRALNASGGGDAANRLIIEAADAVDANDLVTKQQLDDLGGLVLALTVDRGVSGYTNWSANGQLITWNHNLGTIPYSIQITMECTVADAGYSVGNTISLNTTLAYYVDTGGGSTGSNHSVAVWHQSTNQLQVRTGSAGIDYVFKSTGSRTPLTVNRWKFRFYALA